MQNNAPCNSTKAKWSWAGLALQFRFILVGLQQSEITLEQREQPRALPSELEGCTTPSAGGKNHNNITELAEKASGDVARVRIKQPNRGWHILCHQLRPSRGHQNHQARPSLGLKASTDININRISININIRHWNKYKDSPLGSAGPTEQVMATSPHCHSGPVKSSPPESWNSTLKPTGFWEKKQNTCKNGDSEPHRGQKGEMANKNCINK